MEDTEISFPESLLRRNFVMANTKKKTTPVATKKDNTVEIPVVAAMTKAEPKKEAKVEAKKEAEVKKAEPKKVEKAVEVKTVAKKKIRHLLRLLQKLLKRNRLPRKLQLLRKQLQLLKRHLLRLLKLKTTFMFSSQVWNLILLQSKRL